MHNIKVNSILVTAQQ